MRFSNIKTLGPALIAAAISLSVHHQAYALTGDELLKQCAAKSDAAIQRQCQSYIVGVVDGVTTLSMTMHLLHPDGSGYPKLFCAEKASGEELMKVTTAYLVQHPDTRHFNAASEVMLALQQAFPCPN